MKEIIVTPEGRDAIQAGTFVDDAGKTFVALTFQRDTDRVIVTFEPALFHEFVRHMVHVSGTITAT